LVLITSLWLLGAAISATESPDYEAYAAAEGQTIAQIAAEYGISAEYLSKVNRIAPDVALTAGQMIIVPSEPEAALIDPAEADDGEATTPAGHVRGKLGVVAVATAQILDQPGPGKVLFQRAPRGTELLVLGEIGDYYALLMSDGSTGFMLKKSVGLTDRFLTTARPTPPPPKASNTNRSPFIDTAFEYMGIPYKYGGQLPRNVDCSLLVQTVFRRHGVQLPRTAAQQYAVGQSVSVQNLQSGDRLYFYNRAGTTIGHTGLYIGQGEFIHASSNRGKVAVDALSNPTYWSIYAGARR